MVTILQSTISLEDAVISKFLGISILFLIGYGINFFLKNDRLKKYLSVKTYVLFLAIVIGVPILVTLLRREDNLWSDKNTQEVRKMILKQMEDGAMPFNEKQKNEWADCLIEKYKIEFPTAKKSDMNNVIERSKIIGKECAEGIVSTQKLNGWTKKFEDALFDKFFTDKDMVAAVPDVNERGKISFCMIEQLKKTYPTGVDMKDVESRATEIYSPCLD